MHIKPNPRVLAQKSQIRSLLNDFKKIKAKCKENTIALGITFENQNLYNTTERTTPMKVQLLDLQGLVQLKNNLVKLLTQLFDLERELAYKKQKQETKKSISTELSKQRTQIKQNLSRNQSPQLQTAVLQKGNKVSREQSFDQEGRSVSSQIRKQRSKLIEIPIYKSKVETNQSKLDRISKYIASLKKNFKINAEAAGNNWHMKDYLLQDASFIKMKQRLEQFMMREQQIDHLINEQIQKKLKNYFQSCQIEQNDEYRIVKIYKSSIKQKQDAKQLIKENVSSQKAQKLENSIHQIQRRVSSDFNEIKEELEKKNENFSELVSKISEAVEKGNEKLNEIRQKRKKIFEEDDQLWNNL